MFRPLQPGSGPVPFEGILPNKPSVPRATGDVSGRQRSVDKMKNLLRLSYPIHLVQQFGQAKLIKLANGQHELIGGSAADLADAFQWASLFAHELVFTHYHREMAVCCRSRESLSAPRFQPV